MLSLARRLQPAEDRAVGEHRLEPDDLGAHAAVAQHPDAARVRRDQAADVAESRAREVDAEVEPGRPGVLLQRCQRHAGARR